MHYNGKVSLFVCLSLPSHYRNVSILYYAVRILTLITITIIRSQCDNQQKCNWRDKIQFFSSFDGHFHIFFFLFSSSFCFNLRVYIYSYTLTDHNKKYSINLFFFLFNKIHTQLDILHFLLIFLMNCLSNFSLILPPFREIFTLKVPKNIIFL